MDKQTCLLPPNKPVYRELTKTEQFENRVRHIAECTGRTSREVAVLLANGNKWCPRCQGWKPAPEFYRRSSYCRECARDYARERKLKQDRSR